MSLKSITTVLADGKEGVCGLLNLKSDGYIRIRDKCEKGERYCLSMYIKSDVEKTVNLRFYDDCAFEVTSVWTRLVMYFTAKNKDLIVEFPQGTYYLSRWQLEKGTKVSDWKESTADILKDAVAESLGEWCYENDVTLIDGGKIATGTIEAKQIKTKSLTANEIQVDTLFAEDVEATGTIHGAKVTGASGEFTEEFNVQVPYAMASLPDAETGEPPKAIMIIKGDADGVMVGSQSEDALAKAYVLFEPGSAKLIGNTVGLSGRAAQIYGANGIILDGSDVSIKKGLSVGEDLRVTGDIYHNGYKIGETIKQSWSNTTYDIDGGIWTTTIAEKKLAKGVYIATVTLVFGEAAGGRRGVRLGYTQNETYNIINRSTVVVGAGSANQRIMVQTTCTITALADMELCVEGWQDGTGGALKYDTVYMDIIRIA